MTDDERVKEDLRKAAEGSCLCLGYPPACESCTARAALETIEKLEKRAQGHSR